MDTLEEADRLKPANRLAVSSGGAGATARRRVAGLLGLFLLAVFSAPPAASAIDPIAEVTATSLAGYQVPEGVFDASVSGVLLHSSSSLRLGRFDAAGNVVDGDAVVAIFLDFGNAPVNTVATAPPHIEVSAVTPRAWGYYEPTVPQDVTEGPAWALRLSTNGGFSLGSEGRLTLGIALLEYAGQPLDDALGVSVPFIVRVGEFDGFIQPRSTRAFTRGGAAGLSPYAFDGFLAPLSDTDTIHVVRGGSTVPLKWRATDYAGNPVDDSQHFAGVSSGNIACDHAAVVESVDESSAGESGLQYLGDGYWQFNWKTSKSYRNTCRTLYLELADGSLREAVFRFR